jgi:hypothetical protein
MGCKRADRRGGDRAVGACTPCLSAAAMLTCVRASVQVTLARKHRLRRLLVAIGLVSLALGLAWPWVQRLRLGRLPGDLVIQRPHVTFYFPITTSILLSILLSAIIWWLRR